MQVKFDIASVQRMIDSDKSVSKIGATIMVGGPWLEDGDAAAVG